MGSEYDHFLWFDPNIDCTSNSIDDVVKHLETEIRALGKVTRWETDKYPDHIKMIVLNLCHAASIDPTRYVAYSRNKNNYNNLQASRYHAFTPLHGSMMKMVDILKDDLGYIEGVKGFYDRITKISRSAKMRATKKLIDLVLSNKLCPHLITRNPDEEIIILKTKDTKTKKKYEIEYEDTADTIAMRTCLKIVNNEIQKHFIGINVCDDTLAEIRSTIAGTKAVDCAAYDDFDDLDDSEDEVNEEEGNRSWNSGNKNFQAYLDLSKTKLKRVFNNGSFKEGGRFYGAWWQAVPSRYRPYIAIDDQQTIEVDYSGIHINLLYLKERLPLPKDDVYTIEGFPKDARKVMKIALQIMLNSGTKGKALWSIKHHENINKFKDLFKVCTHEQIIEAFKEKHKSIEKYFYKGMGVHLQFIDSQIAEEIMVELSGKGIAVLPIHDSFIVRKNYVGILKEAMREAVSRRYGKTLGLKEDKSAYDLSMDILIDAVPYGDLPLSSEEYEREWLTKHRYDYIRRRDQWGSGRNL